MKKLIARALELNIGIGRDGKRGFYVVTDTHPFKYLNTNNIKEATALIEAL